MDLSDSNSAISKYCKKFRACPLSKLRAAYIKK